jgi:hypothetical protein
MMWNKLAIIINKFLWFVIKVGKKQEVNLQNIFMLILFLQFVNFIRVFVIRNNKIEKKLIKKKNKIVKSFNKFL